MESTDNFTHVFDFIELGGATSSSITESSDDQSECLCRDTSVDSGYGTTYLIKVRGLPWTTTKTDLCKFFRNVHISHDLDGIHFITDDENNVGVAYIQLPTRKDYDLAQSYHHKKLEERYIEGWFFFYTYFMPVNSPSLRRLWVRKPLENKWENTVRLFQVAIKYGYLRPSPK